MKNPNKQTKNQRRKSSKLAKAQAPRLFFDINFTHSCVWARIKFKGGCFGS